MIMLFGNKMLVISDSGEILLDNHVYRMGYSGGKDAKNMMKSINKILKVNNKYIYRRKTTWDLNVFIRI